MNRETRQRIERETRAQGLAVALGAVGAMCLLAAILQVLIWTCSEPPSSPTTPPNWEEVTCDECNGTGKVTYDESSPGIFERDTFTCPMCQGEGTLYIEHRP